MDVEHTTSLDDVKLLGYFETIKSVFLLKLILLQSIVKRDDAGQLIIDASGLASATEEVRALIDDPTFYKALAIGNSELVLNFQEDIMTSLFSASWIVFEQVTKDLTHTDYATKEDDLSMCYQNGRFQFTDREKKDIAFFYYFRNAIQHYNGAYFAYRDLDHRYGGVDYRSEGHHGEKIIMSIEQAWRIANDLERYTIKAWSNAKAFVAR